jgi:hypothetical protein
MPSPASAQIVPCLGGLFCFGGTVLSTVYCDEGVWIILGPPSAGSYMWPYGELVFSNYVPPVPSQAILGWTQGFLTCTVGIYTIGGGLLILAHGGSVAGSI